MSSITVDDLALTTNLDRVAMRSIAGGMDVRIDDVSSTVRSTDDQSSLSPDLLGRLVTAVIDGISQQSHKGSPH
jgi:hypothetical protein